MRSFEDGGVASLAPPAPVQLGALAEAAAPSVCPSAPAGRRDVGEDRWDVFQEKRPLEGRAKQEMEQFQAWTQMLFQTTALSRWVSRDVAVKPTHTGSSSV